MDENDIYLDGRHHKIIGITSSLFGSVRGLRVRNLQFVRANIDISSSTRTGILARILHGSSTIQQVSTCPACAVGDASSISGPYRLGMFVGQVHGYHPSTFRNLLCRGTVTTTSPTYLGGGLVGVCNNVSLFESCHALQSMVYTVPAADSRASVRGAICFKNEDIGSTFKNCHVDVRVEQPDGDTQISVGMAHIHSNVSSSRQPIFSGCAYSPDVVNPVLTQGTVQNLF